MSKESFVSFFCLRLLSFYLLCLIAAHPRPMVPQKDLAVYGYGSVAWKDRMEEWKRKQNEKLQVVKHEGDPDFEDGDDADFPM